MDHKKEIFLYKVLVFIIALLAAVITWTADNRTELFFVLVLIIFTFFIRELLHYFWDSNLPKKFDERIKHNSYLSIRNAYVTLMITFAIIIIFNQITGYASCIPLSTVALIICIALLVQLFSMSYHYKRN